jgi:hypothetical protein
MQNIKQLYRKDYTGEDVSTQGKYENSEWVYTKEYVDNSFSVNPLSDRAVVIGNGISRLGFDLKHFLPCHSTALNDEWTPAYSPKKFLTYGCNALYRDFETDFLVATGEDFVKEISDSAYCDNHIVYATNDVLPQYPNKFHFIPQEPTWNSGAIAAYLAAFDGHKRVFMLGFDGNDSVEQNYNVYAGTNAYPPVDVNIVEDFWAKSLSTVMSTYPDVEFIRVQSTSGYRTPEPWKYFANFRTIDFRQFVIESDL